MAGQIKHALDNACDYSAVGLIGHNPPDAARDDKIENWPHGTFRSVLRELQKSDRAMIMTPVLGGETITGSSRMKGGSGTLIVLETAFLGAIDHVVNRAGDIKMGTISNIINHFKMAVDNVYAKNKDSLKKLINVYGECLNGGGNVRYIASNNYGVLALIDSSECPP